MRRRQLLVALAIVASGCGTTSSGTPSQGDEATGSAMTRTPPPTAEPAPTAIPSLAIDALPPVALDPDVLTAVCDTDPGIESLDEPQSAFACGDAVELVVRAVTAVAGGPVERVYVQRPTCATTPCTQHEVDAAIAYAWIPGRVLGVDVSADLGYLPVPVAGTNGPWPTTGIPMSPAVEAPVIADAPPILATRVPYPNCGHAELGEPASVLRCVRDAVLAGRPAEMTETLFGTEGGEILRVYRFAGAGAIQLYQRFEGAWITQPGSMVIGPGEDTWSFEPWDVPEASTHL